MGTAITLSQRFSAYLTLCKPRILCMVLVTTTIGYILPAEGSIFSPTLLLLLLGAGCVCAGASALNQYLERDVDALMQRTLRRPLVSRVLSPVQALNFGVTLILMGVAILWVWVNLLTAFLSLLTAFLYVVIYTPLKRLSWWNTTLGAIPGALPPVGGWAAATGSLSFESWALFAILFVWQHPHFYSIAWMFRDDYARAGFKMLPIVEPDGKRTFRHIVGYAVLLIPVSLVPFWIGLSGWIYGVCALVAGGALLQRALGVAHVRSVPAARKLLKATVFYLPVLLFIIMLDAAFMHF